MAAAEDGGGGRGRWRALAHRELNGSYDLQPASPLIQVFIDYATPFRFVDLNLIIYR